MVLRSPRAPGALEEETERSTFPSLAACRLETWRFLGRRMPLLLVFKIHCNIRWSVYWYVLGWSSFCAGLHGPNLTPSCPKPDISGSGQWTRSVGSSLPCCPSMDILFATGCFPCRYPYVHQCQDANTSVLASIFNVLRTSISVFECVI